MTNPGISRLMQDGSRSSISMQVLDRIAEALEIPVGDFYQHPVRSADSEVPSAAECESILSAFLRVRDPEIRLRIMDMMRAYSDN